MGDKGKTSAQSVVGQQKGQPVSLISLCFLIVSLLINLTEEKILYSTKY